MENIKLSSEPEDEHQLEILKAVAQAWHGHSGSSRPANEYDAYRRNFQTKPSRFKIEAMNKSLSLTKRVACSDSGKWDFKQSLLDSYEIVSMAKRLERGMVLDDDPFSGLDNQSRVRRRPRESKNSLRNLFNRLSSRRFNDTDFPPEDDNQF
ncbi:uncharacterized protein LOC8278282 [Ricinus communis]|uniref:Uncharacterized protein n=1 Tax=Ricinus communis TaxID=3988 RepID=B9RAU1_RICCO|nr:uncharacterized protein LOC8278282 [Ricinus communis]EEF51918.1 conserved hypothetical protein [Ricinus communis]|eukprot:XP_002511316.1 uncharacterized protein LOC8278282 [Ricinus communis]